MKAVFFIVAGVIALVAMAFAYDMYGAPQFVPAPNNEQELDLGEPLGLVPEFSIETIDGRKASIGDFRGRVVILNFWATWCAICAVEMPDMLNLVDGYGGRVVFFAVSSDNKFEDIDRFINRHDDGLKKLFKSDNVYISLDKNRAITYDLFMTERYPETIIVAPNGDMVRKIVGEFEWGGDEIKQYLDMILRGYMNEAID